MKYVLFTTGAIVVLTVLAQMYITFGLSDVEMHNYVVVSEKGNIEVREYEPAIFISYAEPGGMFEIQNSAFRKLAGYIFGDNVRDQKIAMTAPVQMEEKGNNMLMRFMIPAEFRLDQLPSPNNKKVSMNEEPGFYAAVIRYGGFNNERKFQKHKNALETFIKQENLKISGGFTCLGYNPPFQWFGRRNEVMVKIEGK